MNVELFHSGLDANGLTVGKELLDFLMHSAFHMQRVVGTDIGFRVMPDVIPENEQTSQRHVNRHGASLISLNDQQLHHDVCWVLIVSTELCCQVSVPQRVQPFELLVDQKIKFPTNKQKEVTIGMSQELSFSKIIFIGYQH